MRRNVSRRKLNTIFLFVIAGLYSFISVGYAALSQNLMISGDVSYLYHSRRLYDVLKRAAEDGTYATEYTGSHQDSMAGVGSKKIYHWYAPSTSSGNTQGNQIADMNNVIFAGQCWKMMRTTDTGGVKMIYNGVPNNGQCTSSTITIGNDYFTPSVSNQYPGYNGSLSASSAGYMNNGRYLFTDSKSIDYDAYFPIYQAGIYSEDDVISFGPTADPNDAPAGSVLENVTYDPEGYYGNDYYYETLEGLYIYDGTSFPSYDGPFYVIYVDNTSDETAIYTIPLGNNAIDPSMEIILGESYTYSNGTYTLQDTQNVSFYDWYHNHADWGDYYTGYYTCDGENEEVLGGKTTCSNIHYITSSSTEFFKYISSEDEVLYASGFTYDYETEEYTLNSDRVSFWPKSLTTSLSQLNTHHYTCLNKTDTCEYLAYVFGRRTDEDYTDFVLLKDDNSIQDVLANTLSDNSINLYDSPVKTKIDTWYSNNILNTNYVSQLEDVIYCNNRNVSSLGVFNPNGGNLEADEGSLIFSGSSSLNDLSCPNMQDRFSLANSQALLTYPIALATASEISLTGNRNILAGNSWTMTPKSLYYDYNMYAMGGSPLTSKSTSGLWGSGGVRPVISLIPGIKYTSGTGTKLDPYIINDYIANTSFSDGPISNGTRDVTITFPSGCGNGLTCSYTKDNGSSVNVTSSSVVVNFTSPGTLSTIVSDDTTTLNNSHLVRFDALYVSSSGNDTTGNGSISAPYKTLTKAYDMAEDTSTIYVMNNLTVTATTIFDRYKNITLTSCTKSGDTCPTSSANSIIRGSSFTDYILNNNRGTLDLNTIKVDGNSVSADHSLIVNRTTLNVNSGATLQGANSSGHGGAVYNYGEVTLNGGTITSNNAGTGAGIYNDAGEVEIVSGTVSGNAATRGGGIWSSGVVTMSGGSLVRNTASVHGGAIFGNTTSSTVMTGGTIGGSSANKNTAVENGGGIGTNGTVNLSGSTVISYNEAGRGGGILISSLNNSAPTSTINGITVNNNVSVTGGGIYLYGTDAVLNITNTTINNNTVTNRGGGVYGFEATTLNISGGTISNNSATDGGGIATVATLNVSNSASITKNTASEHGGAIFGNVDSVITVSSATIGGSAANKNTAVSGGGIFYNGSLTVSGSTSTTKITYNEAEAGGGIANTTSTYDSTSSLKVSGGTISYNKSTVQSGGGIYAYGTVQITGGTISNNTSATNGGGIACKTNCTMSGGTISSNSSTSDGGGVRTDGTFTLSGGSVQSNTATSNAFYNNFSIRTTNGANLYDSSASFTADHTKYYIASAVNNNYVIDLTDGAVHGNVQLLQKASNNTHKWKMLPGKAVSGVVYYYIQNQSQTTQCASVSGSSSSTGANILGWEVGDVSGRYFSLEKIGSYYYIKNISGTCVSKGGGSSAANGNNILTATCANSNINKWKFVAA